MRKKVFQHAGALIIAAIILTFFTMSWAMYNNTAEQLRVSVRNECEYYRYFLDKMGDDSLDKPAGKITARRKRPGKAIFPVIPRPCGAKHIIRHCAWTIEKSSVFP